MHRSSESGVMRRGQAPGGDRRSRYDSYYSNDDDDEGARRTANPRPHNNTTTAHHQQPMHSENISLLRVPKDSSLAHQHHHHPYSNTFISGMIPPIAAGQYGGSTTNTVANTNNSNYYAHPQQAMDQVLLEHHKSKQHRIPTPPRRRPEDPPAFAAAAVSVESSVSAAHSFHTHQPPLATHTIRSSRSRSQFAKSRRTAPENDDDGKIQLSHRQVELRDAALSKQKQSSNIATTTNLPQPRGGTESPWEQPFAPSHTQSHPWNDAGNTTATITTTTTTIHARDVVGPIDPARRDDDDDKPTFAAADEKDALERQRELVRSLRRAAPHQSTKAKKAPSSFRWNHRSAAISGNNASSSHASSSSSTMARTKKIAAAATISTNNINKSPKSALLLRVLQQATSKQQQQSSMGTRDAHRKNSVMSTSTTMTDSQPPPRIGYDVPALTSLAPLMDCKSIINNVGPAMTENVKSLDLKTTTTVKQPSVHTQVVVAEDRSHEQKQQQQQDQSSIYTFTALLSRETAGQHLHLWTAMANAARVSVDGWAASSPTNKLKKKPKVDTPTLQCLYEHINKMERVQNLKCIQLVNDKSYAKETKAKTIQQQQQQREIMQSSMTSGTYTSTNTSNREMSSVGLNSSEQEEVHARQSAVSKVSSAKLTSLRRAALSRIKGAQSLHPVNEMNTKDATPASVEQDIGSDAILQTRSTAGSVTSLTRSISGNDDNDDDDDTNTTACSTVDVLSQASSRRQQLSVHIPPIAEEATMDSQQTSSSGIDAATAMNKSKQHSRTLSVPSVPSSAKSTTSSTYTIPWIGVQLRSVTNAEPEDEPPRLLPWAHVELKPVKTHEHSNSDDLKVNQQQQGQPEAYSVDTTCCETDNGDDATNVSSKNAKQRDLNPTKPDIINLIDLVDADVEAPVDQAIVVIPLQNTGSTGDGESCVLIGRDMIWQIQTGTSQTDGSSTWKIPRNDLATDGMTLNMPTLKVTLILRTGARKVLAFDHAEDCLRFATAFYNMSTISGLSVNITAKSMAPVSLPNSPYSDIQNQPTANDECKLIADGVKSSLAPFSRKDAVKTDSLLPQAMAPFLNIEEQLVLERYRKLRQTKPANDALLEALPHHEGSSNFQLGSVTGLSEAEEQLVGQHRKMLGLTIPRDDDKKNTNLNGESLKIINSSVAKAPDSPPQIVSTGDLPSSPLSTFTTTTVGEKSAVWSEKLSASDEQIAARYRLMLKMGIPAEGVRHKMTLENVDVKIAASVFAVVGEQGHREPRQTLASSTVRPAPSQLPSAVDEAVAEKYRKMLKLGIPCDGVRHKMNQDKVEARIVAIVLGEVSPDETKPVAVTKKTVAVTKKKELSYEEESVASQYRKLLKFNVSKDLVLSRMQKEGISEKIITKVLGLSSLSSIKDESKLSGGSASTGSNLINLHWNAIEDVPAGSVWETSKKTKSIEQSGDISKLVQLFQKKLPSAIRNESRKEELHGVGKVKLLDLTRSNNIAISLKAFKEFRHEELANIIGFLDPTRKIRGERATLIRDLIPTTTEMKIVIDFKGTDERLVPAEVWFRHLTGIKRLETKAQVLKTMEMFSAEVSEAQRSFVLLTQTCRQVMASVKLQDVLGLVLLIGNVMNEGTRTGGAAGFRFDSLLRLSQTKTSDGKITVLDYMITVFVSKGEYSTLDLMSDFPNCHQASRLLLSDMTNEVKLLDESLQQCKAELCDLEKDLALAGLKSSIDVADKAAFTPAVLPRVGNEVFKKRDQFLAVANNIKKERAKSTSETDHLDPSSQSFDNSLVGGIHRLRSFIETIEISFIRLQHERDHAMEACKDLSRYCGESGGAGATTTLLDILSQFAKSVEDALKKFDEQQLNLSRKQKAQDVKETLSTKSTDSSLVQNTGEKRSLILMVNDVLKTANPQFKEDFRRGRMISNPSDPLKAIYDREQNTEKLADIVGASQVREDKKDNVKSPDATPQYIETKPTSQTSTFQQLTAPTDDLLLSNKFGEPNKQLGISPAESVHPKLSVKERASMLNTTTFIPRPATSLLKPSHQSNMITELSKLVSSSSLVSDEQTAATERILDNDCSTFEPSLKKPLVPSYINDQNTNEMKTPAAEAISPPNAGVVNSVSTAINHLNDENANKNIAANFIQKISVASASSPSHVVLTSTCNQIREHIKASHITDLHNDRPSWCSKLKLTTYSSINTSSSEDRLRTRDSFVPTKCVGSLAEVMKALEFISGQGVKLGPKLNQEQYPPLAIKNPTKERRSLSERAREKRDGKHLGAETMLAHADPMTPLATLDGYSSHISEQKALAVIGSPLPVTSSSHESSMARLARKKRIQKRMSR